MAFGLAQRRAHPLGLPTKHLPLPSHWLGTNLLRGFTSLEVLFRKEKQQNPNKIKHPKCTNIQVINPALQAVSFSTAVCFVECLLLFRAPGWSSPASGASDPAVPRPSLLPLGSCWGTPICAASSICCVMMLLQVRHLQVHLRAAALLREPKGAVIRRFSEVCLLR